MTTLAGQTAETRRLTLRRRSDLICRQQEFRGIRYWHVKDPVTLRYFQLRPEEFFVLEMLDGTVSLQDVRRRFETAFAPQTLSLSEVQAYLATLHSAGLLTVDAAGQADVLLERSAVSDGQRFWQALSSLLAIRFRGIDPDRFLGWLEPRLRFVFRPWFAVFAVSLMLTALLLAVMKIDVLQARLPRFSEVFSPANFVWLAVVLGITKILHELGHALACRHFGARCGELGLMLLVFTPCLYCNVSDAWMLPSRWQRIVISSAGILVELFLASVALLLWWFSVPGFFNSVCLNVVLVCSISTLIFNGNPLLRYDGYYILSDLMQIPNMRQQAESLVWNHLCEFYCGTALPDQRLQPEHSRAFLAVWSVCSQVYRLFVLWGILWFLNRVFEPLGLNIITIILGSLSIGGMVMAPLIRFRQLRRNIFWSRTVNWPRFVIRSAVSLLLLTALLTAPFPYSVRAPAIIEAEGAARVYVPGMGRLVESVKAGDFVTEGAVLARLENKELEREIVRLEGEVRLLETQLENLKKRSLHDAASVEALIPSTEKRLTDRREQLEQRREDQSRLVLKAPIAGEVLPPPFRDVAADEQRLHLKNWSGTPLDDGNLGAVLDSGTEFCLIGDPQKLEALLAVDETQIEFVRSGQSVTLLIDHASGHSVKGTVSDVSEVDLDVARRELIEHDDFPTRVDAQGVPRPVSTVYQARVRLEPTSAPLIQYGTGRAKISVAPQSLAARAIRFLKHTFRFQ